jgi:hypothetical protein
VKKCICLRISAYATDQKTKEIWDQRDDTYKSIILGYTKASSHPSFPSKTPSKPPFPPKQHCNINLYVMSACEFLQIHSHELEPDPAPDETIIEEPTNEVSDTNPQILCLSMQQKGVASIHSQLGIYIRFIQEL